MFLSHTVVPVFVFTVLFYLYSSTDSLNCPEHFDTCEECQQSTCHTVNCGPCTYTPDNSTFQCFSCKADSKEKPQYYSEDECRACCKDKDKECVCDGTCYECLPKTDSSLKKLVCAMPTMAVDEQCATVPYVNCLKSSTADDDEP